MNQRKCYVICICLMLIFGVIVLSGCNTGQVIPDNTASSAIAEVDSAYEEVAVDYAECYHIYRYDDGCSLITIDDGSRYLLVPDNVPVPDTLTYGCPDYMQKSDAKYSDREYDAVDAELSKGEEPQVIDVKTALQEGTLVVLPKPIDQIYIAASGAMALFDSANAMDAIAYSSLDADSWYIENAKKAIQNGDILFAGKYSEPDYELLLEEGCSLALENTMILHKPETQDKLEEIGIPVMIERSSYESHPLGRTEWIKVYGEMTGHEAEALAYFEKQKQYVEAIGQEEPTGKTVAFFYVSESGTIVTRKTSDYVAKMIGLAGGEYVFQDLGEDEDNASSTVNMTMEDFYVAAKDADYLVYNATIDEPITSVDELIAEKGLFRDFKAVQNGNVWCTGRNMYQSTDVIGEIIQSFHIMMTDEDAEDLTYMVRLH